MEHKGFTFNLVAVSNSWIWKYFQSKTHPIRSRARQTDGQALKYFLIVRDSSAALFIFLRRTNFHSYFRVLSRLYTHRECRGGGVNVAWISLRTYSIKLGTGAVNSWSTATHIVWTKI
jgi:hypothetical protein